MDFSDILNLKRGYAEKLIQLESETKRLEDLEIDVVEKETLYREAKAKSFLKLLSEDVKVTVISAIAAGETARIRREFKIAKGILNASKENIKRIHAGVEGYRTLISIAKAEINLK